MKLAVSIALFLSLALAAEAETLIVPPYPAAVAWKKITDKSDPNITWREWIPADQSEHDVKDILTEQIFPPKKGSDPSEFLKRFLALIAGKCRDTRINGPVARSENGFKVAYAQAYCVGADGLDADIFSKVIAGNDALYVVQREFRRPAAPGAVAGVRVFPKGEDEAAKAALEAQKVANDYLVKQVKLCADEACATSPAPAAPTQPPSAEQKPSLTKDDVSASFGFQPGTTTAREVRDKFGDPYNVFAGPQGSHVYTYMFRNGELIVTLLFDKDDVLVRTLAYAHKT